MKYFEYDRLHNVNTMLPESNYGSCSNDFFSEHRSCFTGNDVDGWILHHKHRGLPSDSERYKYMDILKDGTKTYYEYI